MLKVSYSVADPDPELVSYSVADPDPELVSYSVADPKSDAFLTLGSGMEKKSRSGIRDPGINIPKHISESLF
jgi:hypothetical protein